MTIRKNKTNIKGQIFSSSSQPLHEFNLCYWQLNASITFFLSYFIIQLPSERSIIRVYLLNIASKKQDEFRWNSRSRIINIY